MSEVPPTARDAVLARAARLGASARAVLDVAALIGARVDFPLLELVTGGPPPQPTRCSRPGCSPGTARR